MNKLFAILLLSIISTPAFAAVDNPWIVSHFAGLPVVTGSFTGVQTIVYPALVKNATANGGYYGFQVMECNFNVYDPATGHYNCDVAPNYNDQRLALMHVTTTGQDANGSQFAAGLQTDGDANGRNDRMDLFISDMTV